MGFYVTSWGFMGNYGKLWGIMGNYCELWGNIWVRVQHKWGRHSFTWLHVKWPREAEHWMSCFFMTLGRLPCDRCSLGGLYRYNQKRLDSPAVLGAQMWTNGPHNTCRLGGPRNGGEEFF